MVPGIKRGQAVHGRSDVPERTRINDREPALEIIRGRAFTAGSLSALIVPMRMGNPAPGDPDQESGAPRE